MPRKGYKATKEHKINLSKAFKGRKLKPSQGFQKGNKSGRANKGRKLSEEHKNKLKESHKEMFGEKAPNWKGDKVGYRGLHYWVRKELGIPKKCNNCNKTEGKLHWANKDHTYQRNLEDWISLCSKCHGEYDIKNNLRKFNQLIK